MTLEKFNSIQDHYLRGKLSGIPDCCSAFYNMVWLPLEMGNMDVDDPSRTVRWWQETYSPVIASWGYIPCPHCKLQGNRVEVVIHKPAAKERRVKRAS